MNKPDANISAGADTSAFTQKMDGLTRGVVKKFDEIGKVFMGAIGIGAAFKSIVSAFSAFTAPAAELEDVAVSLGGVLQNAEAGEKLAKSLRRMATNGVVGLEDLHRAARTLAGVMKDPAALTHYVGVLANISSATGKPAESLARLVAGMHDLGKAELTEMSKAGVPICEALGKVLGRTREEVVKLGADGKIAGSDLLAAFEASGGEGGKQESACNGGELWYDAAHREEHGLR